MSESNPCDAALAELLTLTVEVDFRGTTTYRNHLGQRHRVHGPAVIEQSYGVVREFWYQNGLRHRMDGPAVHFSSGYHRWYLNGEEYLTEGEWNERIKSI